MTRDEIVDLLKVIAAYDRRTLGEADVLVWGEQARRGRWTRDEAVEAVHEHHHRSADFMKPAHVDHLVSASRRDRLDRAPTSPIAEERGLRAHLEALADSKAVEHAPVVALPAPGRDARPQRGADTVRAAMAAGERARAEHAARTKSDAS